MHPVDVLLETVRLVLRRCTADDAELLVELDSDPEVMHFITGGLPTSREHLEQEVLPAWLAWHARSPDRGYFLALEKPSLACVGWFHLRPGDGAPDDQPELGYRLQRSAWGRGLATEGSQALIALACRTGARRVVAETMAVHAASRRVMERAGMELVRTFHADWPYPIPGDEHGDVEYAVACRR